MSPTDAPSIKGGSARLFSNLALRWASRHRRHYPWRETRDPYRVLVAEFMLQRTGATQVTPVYSTFLRQFPSADAAAKASERELRRVLLPLGRTTRTKYLRAALTMLVDEFGGRVPDSEAKLLSLPGVGRYTARAVLIFAFQKRLGLFDPNIRRLLARVFGVQSDRPRPHTDPAMWATVDALVPRSRAREFNWAMLDIGARLCLRDRPRCAECPMDQFCAYRRKQELGAA